MNLISIDADALVRTIYSNTDASEQEARSMVDLALPREILTNRNGAQGAADDFLHGVCVALQVITGQDNPVIWKEVVRAAGQERILHFAALVEPDEWEHAGFAKYAHDELNQCKPSRPDGALPAVAAHTSNPAFALLPLPTKMPASIYGHEKLGNLYDRLAVQMYAVGYAQECVAALNQTSGQSDSLTEAARDVLNERQRQINVEGWTPEHDDEHEDRSLARAAACYALANGKHATSLPPHSFWPWSEAAWKPSRDDRRNLVRSCALGLAEIERIDRGDTKMIGGAS